MQKAVAKGKIFTRNVQLKSLNLPTLKYRRHRGDMIELFQIIKGIYYDPSCVPHN